MPLTMELRLVNIYPTFQGILASSNAMVNLGQRWMEQPKTDCLVSRLNLFDIY